MVCNGVIDLVSFNQPSTSFFQTPFGYMSWFGQQQEGILPALL